MIWQKISTAPKDGTPLLLFDDGFIHIGRFADDMWRIGVKSDRGGVCEYGFWVQMYPTHWMPLPEPPHD